MEKRKTEELLKNSPLKIAAAMVYPPNTPLHLVPLTLPTRCKTVISIYVLSQLFADFDLTCKKRITPTVITEGERGFEQTTTYYLTEVIPFFKLVKEHFVGLQRKLANDVTEMKKVFKEMEERVTLNDIALRSCEIERKNLLLTNENLLARCVTQDVYFTATDSTLTACQFQTFSNALRVTQNRVIELEGENSRLLEKFKTMTMITWLNIFQN